MDNTKQNPYANRAPQPQYLEAPQPHAGAKEPKEQKTPERTKQTAVIPEIEELNLAGPEDEPEEEDAVKAALRFVGIGTGQCGGNIADAFYQEGLRGFGAVNSNPQDMVGLKMKHTLCLGDVDGGAGKNREIGHDIVASSRDDVVAFIRKVCGKRYHKLFLMNSTAGGTGSGSFDVMLECAEEASRHIRRDYPTVGAIMALPATGGGYQAKLNTLRTLEVALKAVEDKRLSPLVLVDNSRMQHLANPLSFYQTVNRYIARQLVRFNFVARTGSEVAQFDGGDLLSILNSGVLTFGMTRVKDIDADRSIGKAVKEDFRKNILLDTPIDSVTHAGCIFVGSTATFEGIMQDKIEDGLDSLNRAIAARSVMHHGVYVDESEKGLLITTLLGGLGAPTAYLEALRKEISK